MMTPEELQEAIADLARRLSDIEAEMAPVSDIEAFARKARAREKGEA